MTLQVYGPWAQESAVRALSSSRLSGRVDHVAPMSQGLAGRDCEPLKIIGIGCDTLRQEPGRCGVDKQWITA